MWNMPVPEKRHVQRAEHPHIVKIEGVCGGEAIIEGTRIAVEILLDWDALAPAQVFDALAYYHDDREEIDRLRWENSYEYWKEHQADAAA